VLLSSHALAELESRADRIAIMDRGRLVSCDTLEALRRRADLPVRIRLTMPPERIAALPPRLAAAPLGHGRVEVAIANGAKLPALRELAGADAGIEDIEIVIPSLEAIFAELRDRGRSA
jgi:Cu-processing system ATP-binding protein